ncbi:amidinotransferase [Mucilaginibacter sp. HME9299]|uniref:Amidinotransferase n=2 Tax=Mucilaginibacter aquatilis TaxID=1517760 RepID=A0A6I4I7K5_9SPHI|nr:amidinotransferase [Mucilaginibacter aquatilis]
MIRPASFGYNEQTAGSNAFQQKAHSLAGIEQSALKEFDAFVDLLRSKEVNVIVVDDTPEPHKPDAIFPNNWVSFHDNGDVLMYPMQAENRRYERNEDIIRKLESNFTVKHVIDLSRFELDDKFLEGTGSMVLDRAHKLAYACLSPRTNAEVLLTFCHHLGFKPVAFNAADANGTAIYHTNVMMCIGSQFAVICLDSITDDVEKQAVITSLQATEKEIVAISYEQMHQFAGNMLEVNTKSGKSLLVMSASAHKSLTEEQVNTLEKYAEIVSADITTIETIGGGSARCMLAEVHLPAIA